MIEVEIKLKVEDLSLMEEKLKTMGFVVKALERESDTYYVSDYHDFKANDQALRVRESTDLLTGKVVATFNFKDKKMDQVSMTRPEYETEVSDSAVMRTILSKIGLKPVPSVVKVRKSMAKGSITVCLDDVFMVGSFIELESVVEEDHKDLAFERLTELVDTLGLSMDDSIRRSYLSMLTEKLREKNV